MAEYPVVCTSKGTYVQIEQTSEAIRETYEMCRTGVARGLELRTAVLKELHIFGSVFESKDFCKVLFSN